MDGLDAQLVRGLMDGFPTADLPLGWISLLGTLIAAATVLALVAVAWIAVYTHRRKARRRVGPTMYLPRHPVPKQAGRRWWQGRGERWIEYTRGEQLLPGQDPWRGR